MQNSVGGAYGVGKSNRYCYTSLGKHFNDDDDDDDGDDDDDDEDAE